MSSLFSPLTIRNTVFRNRIGMAPMCQYSAESKVGFPSDWHTLHLGARAAGGAGLIILEATAVEPRGRISPQDLGIWTDEHIPAYKKLVDLIHKQGAKAGIQIAHAGRKAGTAQPWAGGQPLSDSEGGWPSIGPSAIPFNRHFRVPEAMTLEQIAEVKQKFVMAALHAEQAGFDVIEIHGAHGYLLHSFYSPLSNHRDDAYGGSFDNRTRLIREVTQEIRSALNPDTVLFVRLSATDWREDGWTVEDSVALSHHLRELGADLIDCSSGGAIPGVAIPVSAGYQVPLASKIRQEANIPTAAVGIITEAQHAEEIIQNGEADLVLLGRPLLINPNWPIQAAIELKANIESLLPVQYQRGLETVKINSVTS